MKWRQAITRYRVQNYSYKDTQELRTSKEIASIKRDIETIQKNSQKWRILLEGINNRMDESEDQVSNL